MSTELRVNLENILLEVVDHFGFVDDTEFLSRLNGNSAWWHNRLRYKGK